MSVEAGKTRLALKNAARAIFRLRFTVLFLFVMLIVNLLAGSLGNDLPDEILTDWGIGHDSLLSGEAFRLITGTFLSHDTDMFIRQCIFAATSIGYIEWTRGTWRAALLFFGLDITTTLMLLLGVNLGAGIIDLTALNDVGMSMGGFGLIGLALTDWPAKWLLLAAAVLGIAAKLMIAPDVLADGGHLIALVSGFALGNFMPRLAKDHLERGKRCAKKAI